MLRKLKKTTLLLIPVMFLLFSFDKNKPAENKENLPVISQELKDWITADADKRIHEILAKRDNTANSKVTTDCGYAYCTAINYQVGGSSSCTLNMTTSRNMAVPPFSTLCPAPNNFRYGIVYLGTAAQGAIYGTTGNCMEGSLNYTINGTSSYNQQPSYLLVYNVPNGPGGATFVGHVSGNAVNIQCQ
ncbi:MAG: hypothetical protein ABIR18_07085 [Chitinophagaceae bacterium]